MRNAAFPALVRKTREKGEVIRVDIIIIDPANIESCTVFASYGNAIRFRERKQKNADDVRAELFATILKAIIANKSDSIEIRLFVTTAFGSLRKDISDSTIFLTRVDPRAPAMMIAKENTKKPIETMYAMFKTDFEFSKKQSREINLANVDTVIREDSSPEEFGQALVELGFFDGLESINTVLLENTSKLMRSDFHPYN